MSVTNSRRLSGELLGSYDGTNTRYYHFDALGSTVDVTDCGGSSVGSYAYGAWDSVAGTTGATIYPYLYVGQLGYYTHTSDQGAEVQNWLNLGVRFYDPEIGRFERRDPVQHFWNAYTYAKGGPKTFVDPCWAICYRCRRNIELSLPESILNLDRNRHSFFYCNDEKPQQASIGPVQPPSMGPPSQPPAGEFWWGFGKTGCGTFDKKYFTDGRLFIDYNVKCTVLPDEVEQCIKKRRRKDIQDAADCFGAYQ